LEILTDILTRYGDLLDRVLLLVVLIILAFSITTMIFAVYSILLRIRNNRRQKRWSQLERKWEPLILEVLTENIAVEKLTDQVKKTETLFFLEFIMRYAVKIGGHEKQFLQEAAKPFIAKMTKFVNNRDAERRAFAFKTLSVLAFEKYVNVIVSALDDPSPLVRLIAAQALSKHKNPDHIQHVLLRLHSFETWNPSYLSSLLASFGFEAAPFIREALINRENNPQVRSITADALRLLKDPEAADIATGLFVDENDTDLTASLLRIIRDLGHGAHIQVIHPFCNSPDEVIRAQALNALGNIGDSTAAEYLAKGLEDDSPWVSLHAAKGLINIGNIDYLKQVANTDSPKSETAREALREAGI